jgi:hypothetical protein
MTKYAHLTNNELLRAWHTLDPVYLLAELVARMEYAVDKYPDLAAARQSGKERWDRVGETTI